LNQWFNKNGNEPEGLEGRGCSCSGNVAVVEVVVVVWCSAVAVVYLSVYLYICLSICLAVYLFVFLFLCSLHPIKSNLIKSNQSIYTYLYSYLQV
jgi:hypothetical protein